MATIFMRRIQQQDNPEVAQLIRTVMTEYGTVGEGYSIMDKEVDEMFEHYNNDRSAFWILETDEKVIGCGGIGPLKGGIENTCELKKMYFYAEARGKGWGRKMVQTCLDTAKELGYTICYLETVERMATANLLYQKMGFELLDEPMGCTGHSACETRYAKNL